MPRPRNPDRRSLALACLTALLAAPLHAAPDSEAAARAVVARYFAVHNNHHLDDVMAQYAENATFTLSMGRGTITGKAQVRKLEVFDAMAGSELHPFGARFERRADGWHMHLDGVLESSDVFRAMGLPIVRTRPIESTMIIRDGRITAVVQPELHAGCTRTMLAGLAALTTWLQTSKSPYADLLLANGRINLNETTVLETIAAIQSWRAASGWQPVPADIAQCAGTDF